MSGATRYWIICKTPPPQAYAALMAGVEARRASHGDQAAA
ncbi:hypothetical protein MAA8898_02939 [Maliponia aquimaris]|uniref:Uncharacterized protein n=1 Tax=Maliponia aquimaris TaxID=1673631 RepID=A0A238KMD4_9RHOB|nr:hypothetical protein MAA8898_02939 [Maliponia aquimaris]